MNYLIVLFKNKVKKKIIKKFKTSNRANSFYESLLEESKNVIFNKQYENGFSFNYEIAILEKVSGTFLPVFLKDELGRNIKVDLQDDDYSIKKITPYHTEELILDTSLNKKINSKINVTMVHGQKDEVVPVSYSRKVLKIFQNAKKKLAIVKDGDHSLSSQKWLKIIIKELKLII